VKRNLTALAPTVVALGLVAFLGCLLYLGHAQDAAFDRDSITTSATLLDTFHKSEQSSTHRPPRTRYFARVRFAADGQPVSAVAQVSFDFVRREQPGARVEIRYLATDPSQVSIDPVFATRSRGALWLILLATLTGLIYTIWAARRTPVAKSPPLPQRRASGSRQPLPRWVKLTSGMLLLAATVALFTVGVKLRYAVEHATYEHVGWLSLPLGMLAMALPSLGLGALNLLLIWVTTSHRARR